MPRWSDRWAGTSSRHVATLLSGSVLAQIATLAALPLLSRMYTPMDFGQFAVYFSVVALVGVIATLRYEMAIVLPRSERQATAMRRLSLRIAFVSSLLVALASIALALNAPELEDDWRALVLLLSPGVLLLAVNGVQTYWHIRMKAYRLLSISRVTQSVVAAISQVLIATIAEPSPVGLIVGLLLGQFAAVVVLAIAIRSRRPDSTTNWRPLRRWLFLLRKHWRFPALTTPQAVIDAVRINGITLAIGQFSLSALGQYSQAWRVASLPVTLISGALAQVFFPEFASTPRRELYPIVARTIRHALLIGLLPAALIFSLSPALFPWLLGAQWVDAGRYAQALTPWLYLNLAASPISTLFVVLNKQYIGLSFAIVYAGTPIAILLALGTEIYAAIIVMSAAQAALLIVNLLLALWLTRRAGRPKN